MTLLFRALVLWGLILVGAVLNGALRQLLWIPWLGDWLGHVLSAALLSLIVVAVTALFARFLDIVSVREAWLVGGFWLVLTVTFEFLGGHFAFGAPWEALLADYNIAAGRIWILVLATTLVAPRLLYSWR
jgi:hypothetical protein